jgi:hypothetical protein
MTLPLRSEAIAREMFMKSVETWLWKSSANFSAAIRWRGRSAVKVNC